MKDSGQTKQTSKIGEDNNIILVCSLQSRRNQYYILSRISNSAQSGEDVSLGHKCDGSGRAYSCINIFVRSVHFSIFLLHFQLHCMNMAFASESADHSKESFFNSPLFESENTRIARNRSPGRLNSTQMEDKTIRRSIPQAVPNISFYASL